MSRPPKTPEQRALQGDARQRGKRKSKAKSFFSASPEAAAASEVPAEAPQPEQEQYPPPAMLSERGKEIWRAELKTVMQRTMLKATDFRTFALYCNEVARLEKLETIIADRGEVYETASKHGSMLRANPACALRDKCLQTVIKLAQELNLTTKSWIASEAIAKGRQLNLFDTPPPAPPSQPSAPAAQTQPARPSLAAHLASKPDVGLRH